ncbi:hypothetical protein BN14_06318 [Rhizoctonia solani AG-1 IB]|uniref:Uncharacterized protein n=1 Tax=Thanatephorus cucumeris (strain AG1-IB / isolate 7/3/14) TaxID=1108050 RepID=M5BX99_THACB|nr:hypothetical protein BN14_06318 [Rhizoctonia solani AG-1 IB]
MVAQAFSALKHKLFPSFEPKRYHLQFRHATLVTFMLTCASFTLPAYHQTMPYEDSDYFGTPDFPVESSYNRIHRFVNGAFYYNIVVSFWIAFCLVAEGVLQRSSPVWYELAWMGLTIIGEIICLGLMASSRPEACDYHFGIDRTFPINGKFSPKNSITSICSNWRGMTGLLAAIVVLFLLHVTWHLIIASRYMRARPGYLTTPIPDYRWTLSRPLDRLEPSRPSTDIEKAAAAKEKQLETTSSEFTSRGTESLSYPLTPTSEDYSNFSRLPANSKPVVIEQVTVARSDTSSIVEADGEGKAQAPFSYSSK